jgi:hypothetical protein
MNPDQPAHPHSLIRIHADRYQFLYLLYGSWILIRPRRLDGSMLVTNPLSCFLRDAANFTFLAMMVDDTPKHRFVVVVVV